jgi:hypothetical protein
MPETRTKEQRDEAIKPANESAGKSQAGMLAVDASFGQASSFAGEAILDEDHTLSQEFRDLLNEDSNTTTNLQESETSSCELALDYRLPV